MRQTVCRQLATVLDGACGNGHPQRDTGSGIKDIGIGLVDDPVAAFLDHIGPNPRLQGNGVFEIQQLAVLGDPSRHPVHVERFANRGVRAKFGKRRRQQDGERQKHIPSHSISPVIPHHTKPPARLFPIIGTIIPGFMVFPLLSFWFRRWPGPLLRGVWRK